MRYISLASFQAQSPVLLLQLLFGAVRERLDGTNDPHRHRRRAADHTTPPIKKSKADDGSGTT